ncbi:hypothetical protein DFH09DRAFT_1089281 [Mycena vulgaris]|nr:hypothetical protein DFH09DRAFT_1089281 [Mycena vulgaris]
MSQVPQSSVINQRRKKDIFVCQVPGRIRTTGCPDSKTGQALLQGSGSEVPPLGLIFSLSSLYNRRINQTEFLLRDDTPCLSARSKFTRRNTFNSSTGSDDPTKRHVHGNPLRRCASSKITVGIAVKCSTKRSNEQ